VEGWEKLVIYIMILRLIMVPSKAKENSGSKHSLTKKK
jgi:hypothetical protein